MPVNNPVVALLNNAALTIQRLATAPPIKGADYPSLRLAHVLRNGAIEKELKFILAMVWEGSHGNRRACVMEKEFFGSKLDFVAFEKEAPTDCRVRVLDRDEMPFCGARQWRSDR